MWRGSLPVTIYCNPVVVSQTVTGYLDTGLYNYLMPGLKLAKSKYVVQESTVYHIL